MSWLRSCAASVVFLAACAPAQTAPADRARLFAWFDTLGYDAIRTGKFVKVVPADKRYPFPYIPMLDAALGFLESESATEFTVIGSDLREYTFAKTEPGPKPVGSYKAADLKQAIANESFHFLDPNVVEPVAPQWGVRSDTRLFVLARACVARGLEREGNRLFDQVDLRLVHHRNPDRSNQTAEQVVKEDIGAWQLLMALCQFSNPSISRAAILKRIKAFETEFPDYGSYGAEAAENWSFAQEADRTLAEMVAQSSPAKRPFSKMSNEELIFCLRDQPGGQWWDHGAIEVNKTGAVLELLNRGPTAVPELSRHLDDQQFTRATAFTETVSLPRWVLRVGTAVRQILDWIAGHKG